MAGYPVAGAREEQRGGRKMSDVDFKVGDYVKVTNNVRDIAATMIPERIAIKMAGQVTVITDVNWRGRTVINYHIEADEKEWYWLSKLLTKWAGFWSGPLEAEKDLEELAKKYAC